MNLVMPIGLAAIYKSPAQKARVVGEAWAQANLYCANCQSSSLNPAPNNTEAYDYRCPHCGQHYQLKCMGCPIGTRIVDAALAAMLRAIREDRTPNLIALHYERESWTVRNVLLIPHFALSPSAIAARKPLSPQARRAGWVGCFIVLQNIPIDARIHVVKDGIVVPSDCVRDDFSRLRPLKQIPVTERGWTLDVLRVLRSLGKREFTNSDIYRFTPELAKIHPENRHIRDKIRQQLQFLRDRGFISQLEKGIWRTRE